MKKEQFTVSLFWDESKGIYNTDPYSTINFTDYRRIATSDWLRMRTAAVMAAQDDNEKTLLKRRLPYVTPYGSFVSPRSNVNLVSYNSNIVALDLDDLGTLDAQLVRDNLANKDGCLASFVSPRGKGVKALFLISGEIPKEGHLAALVYNKERLGAALGLENYLSNIDISQFKLAQPFFLSYDKDAYINESARPLEFELIPVENKPKEQIRLTYNDVDSISRGRIEKYLIKKTQAILDQISREHNGSRQPSIIELAKVKSDLHYAPEIESELEEMITNALDRVFESDGKTRQDDAYRYYKYVWSNADSRNNEKIESIIKENQQ